MLGTWAIVVMSVGQIKAFSCFTSMRMWPLDGHNKQGSDPIQSVNHIRHLSMKRYTVAPDLAMLGCLLSSAGPCLFVSVVLHAPLRVVANLWSARGSKKRWSALRIE